jgi:hypothetical protein
MPRRWFEWLQGGACVRALVPLCLVPSICACVGCCGSSGDASWCDQGLKPYAEDPEFRKKWAAIKYHNKERFAMKLKVRDTNAAKRSKVLGALELEAPLVTPNIAG